MQKSYMQKLKSRAGIGPHVIEIHTCFYRRILKNCQEAEKSRR